MMFVVDLPLTKVIGAKRPPLFCTMSAPTMSLAAQSAPLARMSGFIASMSFSGVGPLNSTTKSTHSRAERTSERSRWGTMGRAGPLMERTELSLLSPTTSTSPSDLAFLRYLTWPACRISKQPFVKTTFFFFLPEASSVWSFFKETTLPIPFHLPYKIPLRTDYHNFTALATVMATTTAPARLRTFEHSFSVAPVVTTSSTRRTFFPLNDPGSTRVNAPETFFFLSRALRPTCWPVSLVLFSRLYISGKEIMRDNSLAIRRDWLKPRSLSLPA